MEQVINANQHIRRMRGGAQSHLMKCEDGNHYVVKFQNNPQHRRVLANEVIATKLAAVVGLPVPETSIIAVSDWLVEHTQELRLQNGGCAEKCEAGLQFGASL
jgi:glutathione synthase/RimK-type ligase-like ATP-grasp enzyme